MLATRLQGRLIRLCQKELKETIRDRRTIVTLVLMPLLVYPLLSMALNRFLLTSASSASEQVVYAIGVETSAEEAVIIGLLTDPRSAPPDAVLQASGGELANFEITVTSENDESPRTPVEALEANLIDVAAKVVLDDPPRITFTSFRGDNASLNARRVLVERLQWLRLALVEESLNKASVSVSVPAAITINEIGEPESESMLATIVPLVLVLMTITGAVYPAIDLTAGERERGTMESLMASPVPRFYVLFAKYTAVVTVALLTALANLFAMFTTLWAGGLLELLTGSQTFPWIAVLQILGLLVLFSGFFSAMLLSLTSFAKSFKEAQAYLIPVMLLSLAPAMLSLMPGIKLAGLLAVAPLINIVLLARDVLSGGAEGGPAFAAIASTVAYGAATLGIASRLFGSDAVTRTSEQSIGSLFHRPEKTTDVPSPSSAAMMLALLVPIYFVCSSVLLRVLGGVRESIQGSAEKLTNDQAIQMQMISMVASAVVLILVFGLIPLAAAFFGRNRYQTTYRVFRPNVITVIGALLAGMGAWAIAYESMIFADALGIGGLDVERLSQTKRVLELWKEVPSWLLLATLALTPAIIEELCFRGYLFSSLSKVLTPGRVIVVTAVLFGLFHVFTGGTLLVERFVPSTLLGLVLGWIAYRTGSVFPGIVMHFVHNGLLELVGQYKDDLAFLGDKVTSESHLPASWIAIATSIAVIGLALVWAGTIAAKGTATEQAHAVDQST